MAQLRQDHVEFERRGVVVVVAGPEGAESFRRTWEQEALPFVGLPDPDHRVLKLYGQQVKIFKLGRLPAQVIVDREGIARYVHYGHSMSDIPENRELFAILDALNTPEPPERKQG